MRISKNRNSFFSELVSKQHRNRLPFAGLLARFLGGLGRFVDLGLCVSLPSSTHCDSKAFREAQELYLAYEANKTPDPALLSQHLSHAEALRQCGRLMAEVGICSTDRRNRGRVGFLHDDPSISRLFSCFLRVVVRIDQWGEEANQSIVLCTPILFGSSPLSMWEDLDVGMQTMQMHFQGFQPPSFSVLAKRRPT
jgi:hypothetical protein